MPGRSIEKAAAGEIVALMELGHTLKELGQKKYHPFRTEIFGCVFAPFFLTPLTPRYHHRSEHPRPVRKIFGNKAIPPNKNNSDNYRVAVKGDHDPLPATLQAA